MKKSMSVVLLAAFSLISISAFASALPAPAPSSSPSPTNGLSVQITSFTSINAADHTAELCGQVTLNAQELPRTGNYIAVTVTSDPKFNPGPYTVLADPTGAFCVVILTQTGTAEASAWLPSDQLSGVSGVAKFGVARK